MPVEAGSRAILTGARSSESVAEAEQDKLRIPADAETCSLPIFDSVRRRFVSPDGSGPHRSTRTAHGDVSTHRMTGKLRHPRNRKIAGPIGGRRLGARRRSCPKPARRARSWRCGESLVKPDVSQAIEVARVGRRSRTLALQRDKGRQRYWTVKRGSLSRRAQRVPQLKERAPPRRVSKTGSAENAYSSCCASRSNRSCRG